MITNVRISGAQSFPYSESDIRVNFNDPTKIIAAANAIKSGSAQGQFYSTDSGATWGQTSLSLRPGDAFHSDPCVEWTSDGTAWSITIGINAVGTMLQLRAYKSIDNGKTWTYDADASAAQTATDKQLMWVDHSPSSPHKDNIYVIWHNNAPVFVNRRTGPGGSWQAPLQVSGAETTGTGIGGDITTNSAGDVFAFWPDDGSGKLLVAKSTDGGVTFGAPVTIATTFDRFDIGIPSFVNRRALIYISGAAYHTATKDLVYAVWADQTGTAGCNSPANEPGSSVASSCKTRIWFARSTDGGATWGAATMINNQASKNDQFNQRLAVDPTNGQLAVMYYDTVGDSARLKSDVWMQTSDDDGATWSSAFRVTTAQTDETSGGQDAGNQYGDYNGLSGTSGTFFPCWTDRRSGGREEIWTAAVSTRPVTLKVFDDGGVTLKAVDDIGTLKAFDDITTLKTLDDISTFKAYDDIGTLKALDDIGTLKAFDDIGTLKALDDIGPGPKGPSDVKIAGGDVGPEGPGIPVQQGGLSQTPFILATPHHSMAWAAPAGAQASRPASFEELIPQYQAALATLEQAMQQGAAALQQLDAQYRQIRAEYEAVVDAYRAQLGEGPGG